MIKDLITLKRNSFLIVEKGVDIYQIEYILLYNYDYYNYNDNDPHKNTHYKIGDLSDGKLYFTFWLNPGDPKKYMSIFGGVVGDIVNGITQTIFSANQLLREYKINDIKTKIKEL